MTIRSVASTVKQSRLVLNLAWIVDSLVLRVGMLSRPRRPRTHLALVPPADGNIGDLAMIECLVAGSVRPVIGLSEVPGVLLQRSSSDASLGSGARFVDLAGLIHGFGASHLRALFETGRFLADAAEFTIVGADMMDGGYGRLGAFRRWSVATFAARSGVPTRVAGFSLNANVDPVVASAALRADGAGVISMLRDPVSFARGRTLGLERAREAKDLVFSRKVRPRVSRRVKRVLDEVGGTPFVVVNCSGLVQKHFDQLPEYERVLRFLDDRGLRVVLLPHVSHEGSDDKVPLRRLHALSLGKALMVEELWEPDEVLALVKDAALVITGRMHLSVLALTAATPAIVVSTQGKVEGLMRDVGLPAACIDPGPRMGARIRGVAGVLLDAGDDLSESLTEAAERFEAQAMVNFSVVRPA